MGSPVPIFTDKADVKLWKELAAIEESIGPKNADRVREKFERLLRSMYNGGHDPDPRIICKIIDIGMSLPSYVNKARFITSLVKDRKASDCVSRMKAAELLIGMSELGDAAHILDSMPVRNNIAEWEYLRGIIYRMSGDASSAEDCFVRSYLADSSLNEVYGELEGITLDGTWAFRKSIESMWRTGNIEPGAEIGENPIEDLCNIYRESLASGYKQAVTSLKSTTGYASGDFDHILAMARFLYKSGKYEESAEEYRRICGGYLGISLELVDVYLEAGMIHEASELCHELESIGPGDRRLIESLIRICSVEENRDDMGRYVDMYRNEDYADTDSYVMMIEAMLPLSMYANIEQSIRFMKMSEADEGITSYLSSKSEYEQGAYSSAFVSIKKALRIDSGNQEYRLHKLRIQRAMGATNIMPDIDAVLRNDPKNVPILGMKKDVLVANRDYEGAINVCETIRSITPDDADVISDIALIYKMMGRTEESIKAYREALDIKSNPELFIKFVKGLLSDGRYEETVSIVREYDDTYGNIPGAWVMRGNAEYALERYSDAVESYDRALELNSEDHSVWHSRGMAAEAMEDYGKAESSYDRAILLKLDCDAYWISKSAVQEKNGNDAGAIRSLNRVIGEHQDNCYALMKKAHILSKVGKNSEAMVFIDLALKIESGNIGILKAKRDLCTRMEDYNTAVKISKAMIRLNPNDDSLKAEEVRILTVAGKYPEALKAVDDISDQNSLETLILRRNVCLGIGSLGSVIDVCTKIREIAPDDRENLTVLADAYRDTGRKDEASVLYGILNEDDPSDTNALVGKATMASDSESALGMMEQSLAVEPDNIELLFGISDLLMSMGKYNDADRYLAHIMELEPESPEMYVRKARLQMKHSLYGDAVTTVSDALDSSLSHPELWMCLGDAEMELGDPQTALSSYGNILRTDDSYRGIHTKCGLAHMRMGDTSAALKEFETAYQQDSRDIIALSQLAMIHMDVGSMNAAADYLNEALATDPYAGTVLLAEVKFHLFNSEFNEAKETLALAEQRCSADTDSILAMKKLISQYEEENSEENEDADNGLEKYALDLIRISNEEDLAPNDEKALSDASIPPEIREDVLNYMGSIEEYGAIVPDTPEFERMEKLSYNAVVNGELYDIGKEGEDILIPLYCAVFDSGSGSVEEGKKLIAYIAEVLSMDMEPAEYEKNIATILSHMLNVHLDVDLYSLMERYEIGIFAARTARLLYDREISNQ